MPKSKLRETFLGRPVDRLSIVAGYNVEDDCRWARFTFFIGSEEMHVKADQHTVGYISEPEKFNAAAVKLFNEAMMEFGHFEALTVSAFKSMANRRIN